MKTRTLVGSLTFCLLAACGAAQATSIDSLGVVKLRFMNELPGGYATIHRPGHSTNTTVMTGQYNLQLDPSYTPANPADESNLLYKAAGESFMIGAFCADVHESAPIGGAYVRYDIVMPESAPIGGMNTPMSVDKANALRRLYGSFGGLWLDGKGDDNQEATAFELCIWEIVFETAPTYSVSTGAGAFYATRTYTLGGVETNARDIANAWLSGVGSGDVPDIALRVLANDGLQDYAIVVPGASDISSVTVPEPLTVLGLLMGVGGLAGYIRNRRAA